MVLQYPYPAEKFDLIGRVTRSHGLKGEIKVLPLKGSTDTFRNYSRVALVATDGRMTDLLDILSWRIQGKMVILKLATIDSKSEADLTAAMGVLCLRSDSLQEDIDSDDFSELVGLEVTTPDSMVIGTIESVSHSSAQPIMVIVKDGEEFLVPLVDEMVVDRRENRIIIDPPPGLLEINRS